MTFMISTTFLAQFLGIFILVISFAVLFRPRLVQEWISKTLRKPSTIFLVGVFEFMAGLLLVLGHQDWGSFRAGLVSLLGWLFVAESLLYLFLPRASLVHLLGRVNRKDLVLASAIVGLGIGVVLTLFGFGVL